MAQHLLRSKVNALIKSLQEAGVGPDVLDFKEETLRGKLAVSLPLRISTTDGTLYFEIGYHDSRYWVDSFPGRSDTKSNYYEQWEPLLVYFKRWVQQLSHELAEPDPWLLVRQGNLFSGDIPLGGEGESPFGESELKAVHRSLGGIRAFLLAEAQPNSAQLGTINKRLEYLEECAKTQDKKGWSYTAVGVIFTIGAALSLSPEQGRQLLMLTSEMIRAIFLKLLT